MQFDFDRFSRIATRLYRDGNLYSLEECLGVFRLYFQTYEEYMGHPHPPIRASQIARIMETMPEIELKDKGNSVDFIPSECYQYVIARHFRTEYRHCDYNINHFFSGRIRELRWYELNNGYE